MAGRKKHNNYVHRPKDAFARGRLGARSPTADDTPVTLEPSNITKRVPTSVWDLGKKLMTPEGKVKKDIKDYLTSLGPSCKFFMPQNMGRGESGISDIVGCYVGTAFVIEVKADETKKPTPWQVRFQIDWSRAGGRVLIAHHIDPVVNFMESIYVSRQLER